jgi:hypothetical protein
MELSEGEKLGDTNALGTCYACELAATMPTNVHSEGGLQRKPRKRLAARARGMRRLGGAID